MKEKKDTVVSPIYKWSDSEIWDYIRERQYPYNPMYDMGYHRVGCVGCPLATYGQKIKEFNDFPYYKGLYIKAFQKMIEARKEKGKPPRESWETGEDVFNWWIEEYKHNVKGQMTLEWEDE